MSNERIQKLTQEIMRLHDSVATLKNIFPSKKDGFTLDGRLVGDIGEVVAEELFQIKLHEKLEHHYDAVTTYEPFLKVQIKATFKESLTFNHNPDYFIGIKLCHNGNYSVIYNGPGKYISEAFKHRKGLGEQLLSFSIKRLKEIDAEIPDNERILKREEV